MILRYSNCGWNCNGVKRFHHAQLLDAEEDEWEEWLLCSTNTSHIIQCLHHLAVQRLQVRRSREVVALARLRRQVQRLRDGRLDVARPNLRRQRVEPVADSHLPCLWRGLYRWSWGGLWRRPWLRLRLGGGSFDGSPGGQLLLVGDHHRVDRVAARRRGAAHRPQAGWRCLLRWGWWPLLWRGLWGWGFRGGGLLIGGNWSDGGGLLIGGNWSDGGGLLIGGNWSDGGRLLIGESGPNGGSSESDSGRRRG